MLCKLVHLCLRRIRKKRGNDNFKSIFTRIPSLLLQIIWRILPANYQNIHKKFRDFLQGKFPSPKMFVDTRQLDWLEECLKKKYPGKSICRLWNVWLLLKVGYTCSSANAVPICDKYCNFLWDFCLERYYESCSIRW